MDWHVVLMWNFWERITAGANGINKLLDEFSKSDSTVLDPFLDSGTTARACKDLGRKCIGIEISKEYCDIAVKRLGQEVLF